jgi:hypothetical protein
MADSFWERFKPEIWAHKLPVILSILLGGIPVGAATIYQALTHDTLPDWLAKHGWPRLITLVEGWVSVVAIVAIVIVIRSLLAARKPQQAKQLPIATDSVPVIHATFDLKDIFRKHHRIEMNNPKPLILHNEGNVSAFEVTLSDVDLGGNRVAKFPMVPHVAGTPIEVMAEIEQAGVPLLGRHDLAGALTSSIYEKQSNQPWPGPKIEAYVLRITYRNVRGEWFESLCEIRVSDPPSYSDIKTVFVTVREIPRPQPPAETTQSPEPLTRAKPDFKVDVPAALPGVVKLDVNVFKTLSSTTAKGVPKGSVFPVVARFENIPDENSFSETETVSAHIVYKETSFANMELMRVDTGCWVDQPQPDISFPFRKARYLLLGGWSIAGKKPLKNEFKVFEYSPDLHRATEKSGSMAAPRTLLVEVVLTSTEHPESNYEYYFELNLLPAAPNPLTGGATLLHGRYTIRRLRKLS